MILDSSAIIAILLLQEQRDAVLRALRVPGRKLMSTFSVHETGSVLLHRKGAASIEEMYRLLRAVGVRFVPFTELHSATAIDAYRRFGKGVQSPGLNMGDCAVYALAIHENLPVLSTTDEFARAGLSTLPL